MCENEVIIYINKLSAIYCYILHIIGKILSMLGILAILFTSFLLYITRI